MITEDFTNYAKGALSHQLARRIAAHQALSGYDTRITYHRAEHASAQATDADHATITFTPKHVVTVHDYNEPKGHGVIVTMTVGDDTRVRTQYLRHMPTGVSDDDWHTLVIETIVRTIRKHLHS